jgi:hypothetical protein
MRLVLTILSFCSISNASNQEDALKKVAEAFYIQSGIDKVVEKLDKKYTPEVVKEYGGWLLVIQDSVVSKQISYKWEYKF